MDWKVNNAISNLLTLQFGCIIFTQAIVGLSALCTLPIIPHGKVISHSDVQAEEQRKIICDSGYKISGNSVITCRSDGSWSSSLYGGPSIPECIALTSKTKCPLPNIPHGKTLNPDPDWLHVHDGERLTGVEVVCDTGFKREGTPFIVCKDGSWSPTSQSIDDFPKCIRKQSKTCPPLTHVKYAEIDYMSMTATVRCHPGYHMMHVGSQDMPAQEAILTCSDGQWVGPVPTCGKSKTCLPVSHIKYAEIDYMSMTATVRCCPGYHMIHVGSPDMPAQEAILTCSDGQWVGPVPTCVLLKPCPQPPQIPYANVQYYNANPVDGSKVTYHCHNRYTMDNPELAELTCVNGEWPGKLPTCTITIRCETPQHIPNGHWTRVGGDEPYTVNTKIQYECNDGFRTLGESLMWCKEDQSWSHMPPRCIALSDESVYCSSPPDLPHGECTCGGHDQSYCEPFMTDMRWLCHCGAGYALEGAEALICTASGEWNHDMPECVPVSNQINGDSDSTTPDSSHISTLAIVVATACSVLGVLLLVMVAVIFRRHKPRPRLYHTTPAPPPYTRVHSNSVDEHDRVALIAYAEGRQVALPTYEEAIRGGQRAPAAQNFGTTAVVVNEGAAHGQQYRPLPPVPAVLRGTQQPNSQQPNPADNNNRHSTATTSTVHNRDGFSEVFGSLDTVNVSISDASTAGTMETVDSGASNPSLASRRANAGSLGSSNGSLANDDARLLESSHDERIMSTSSEPLPEEDKEE